MRNPFARKKDEYVEQTTVKECHVDIFEMHGDILKLVGWMYDEEAEGAPRSIAFHETDGRLIYTMPANEIERPDLVDAFHSEGAKSAGFGAFARIGSPRDIAVFIEYETEDGKVSEPLGVVNANADEGKLILVEPATDDEALFNDIELGMVEDSYGSESRIGIFKGTSSDSISMEGSGEELWGYLNDASRPAIVAITHSLGGGADHYLTQMRDQALTTGRRFVTVRYDCEIEAFTIEAMVDGTVSKVAFPTLEAALNLVKGTSEVWANEFAGYPNLAGALACVPAFAKRANASLVFLMHDYAAICQSRNLMNWKGEFCGVPDYRICSKCFQKVHFGEFAQSGIFEYRALWRQFFYHCTKIIVFSEDSKRLLGFAFPDEVEGRKVEVIPHSTRQLRPIRRRSRKSPTLTIGILGVMSKCKGAEKVKSLARLIGQNDLDAEVVLIGYSQDPDDLLESIQTGRYDVSEIPQIVADKDVDVFLIPSIIPETFSYTVAEIMDMNLPIAVYNVGAPEERVLAYEKGVVLPLDGTAEETYEALKELAFGKLHLDDLPVDEPSAEKPPAEAEQDQGTIAEVDEDIAEEA